MPQASTALSISDLESVKLVQFTSNRILDEANIAEIRSALHALIEQQATPEILIDFSNVDHLSSAALGVLIDINKRVREKNGKLRLASIKPQIYDVFVITKLNQLFKILSSRQEALASFKQV